MPQPRHLGALTRARGHAIWHNMLVIFALMTLAPLALLALATQLGGLWIVAALLWMTGMTASLDELVRRTLPVSGGEEFPAADGLSVAIALGQLVILALTVQALGADGLGTAEKAGLFAAAGLYVGQVGNANAHELIHRRGRWLRALGIWAYASVLFAHHASAHVLVHHVRVATRADPSTARRGESLYRFIGRSWKGGFREGWRIERDRLARTGRPAWRHPYLGYGGAMALVLAAAALLGGAKGLALFIGLAGFAQMQLLMSDYVQHYGLMRTTGADGRAEPVGNQHSWNAPHPVSGALMLNAPRHSDHHAHPARAFPGLRLPPAAEAPRLPRSLPVMACVALWPALWRRVMDPRLQEWELKG
jgi:alkane 1-monooxygenase